VKCCFFNDSGVKYNKEAYKEMVRDFIDRQNMPRPELIKA